MRLCCRKPDVSRSFPEYFPERPAHSGKLAFRRNHKKHGKQSGRGKKEDKMTESVQQNRSGCRTGNKTHNHQIIVQGFPQFRTVFSRNMAKERFSPAPQIACTHRRSERKPVNPAESLNLKRTDE